MPAEHGAGGRVRLEGVLHRGGQGAGARCARRMCWRSSPPSAPAVTGRCRRVDGEAGVSARTMRRRLSSVSGLFGYLRARGEVAAQPGAARPADPAGSAARRGRACRWSARRARCRGSCRRPRSTRCWRRCARGGTGRWSRRCCSVGCAAARCSGCGWRICSVGERRVFIAEGKGGHQRLVPVSARFFAAVGAYLDCERPGRRRHRPGVRRAEGPAPRASRCRPPGWMRSSTAPAAGPGWHQATCHQLRHTCLTRLREAGMALEAVQAQAGHASIESTRIYLHLADDWLAAQYRRAAEAIDAQVLADRTGAAERPVGRALAAAAGLAAAWARSRRSAPDWPPRCAATWTRSPACCAPAASAAPTWRCGPSPPSSTEHRTRGDQLAGQVTRATSRTSSRGWPPGPGRTSPG